MERTPSSPPPKTRGHLVWVALLLGLLVWHGWITLSLFDPEQPLEKLLNDQPVISGYHPLHLYHGYLGARSLHATGRSTCYDPDFQIGYPKTPVFDAGSRPAELFLALAGGEYRPAAYKVGLVVACLLVPLLLIVAARGLGMEAGQVFFATATGLLVWWGGPGRLALESGEFELLLAGLAVLAHVGLLVRYDRSPGPGCWLGLLLTGCLGWFSHPLLLAILLPLLLIYYLTIGARHPHLTWHLALLIAQLGALALNAFWLGDWVEHWWIRSELPQRIVPLTHRTFHSFWEAPIWGAPADRALAMLLLGSALVGVCIYNQMHQRATARLLGLGAVLLVSLALLGISWAPLGRYGTAGLLVPGLWFAALPAVHAWRQVLRVLAYLTGGPARGALAAALLVLGTGGFLHEDVLTFMERCRGTRPLQVGLGAEREALVATLKEHTTPEARILWEDRAGPNEAPRWPALLPLLTGRPFLGGLDPDGAIEHSKAGFLKQKLAGRPIREWTDHGLKDYCHRYNVGWVVAWSPAAVARFRAWQGGAVEVAAVADGGEGTLFKIQSERPSFALKGKAKLLLANSQHISLADVDPEDGRVVLSLHYQAGMRASPSRVQIEKEQDPLDDIPFVRLRVASPVARVTLTWDD